MKKILNSLLLLAILMFFPGCDDTNVTLLEDLAQGKMVVVINDGTEELLDCKFYNYGANFAGEVMIQGLMESPTQNDLTIMYGNMSNETPMSKRSYVTTTEADKINVSGSYGYGDENNAVTIKITEITDTAIKGEFSGKIRKPTGESMTIKGAFWATRGVIG
jgi:hypothetical protein